MFIATNAFMFDALVKQTAQAPKIVLAVVGIAVSILFNIMEQSSVRYWNAFVGRAKEIEAKIGGLELMTKWRPRERLDSGTKATYALYYGVMLLWVTTFFWK